MTLIPSRLRRAPAQSGPKPRPPLLRFPVWLLLAAWLLPAPWPGGGPLAAEKRLPIFDAHVHYSRDAWSLVPPEGVRDKLAAAHVPRALVSSSPDDGTLTLHRLDPGRFLPVLRPYRGEIGPSNWFNDPATPGYLETRLARREYHGIGEFHLFSTAAARTPVVRKVAAMAARRGIFLHVHADAEPVEALFEGTPGLKILWAHAGMVTPPARVRRMMERHRNLWAEVSFRDGEIHRGATLAPAWRALLMDFTSRFMIGTDTYANHRWVEYGQLVEGHRRWLALLPPEKARDIAYRNAARLFGWGRLKPE